MADTDLLVMRKHMVRAFKLMSRALDRASGDVLAGTDLGALIDDYVTTKVEYMLALKGVEEPHAKTIS